MFKKLATIVLAACLFFPAAQADAGLLFPRLRVGRAVVRVVRVPGRAVRGVARGARGAVRGVGRGVGRVRERRLERVRARRSRLRARFGRLCD